MRPNGPTGRGDFKTGRFREGLGKQGRKERVA